MEVDEDDFIERPPVVPPADLPEDKEVTDKNIKVHILTDRPSQVDREHL